MSSHDRRAAGRRRAWGRGPIILRFEPLEARELLSSGLPDLVASSFSTPRNLDWGNSFDAVGQIENQGNSPAQVPFLVDIYASSKPYLTANSVMLGQATIPAGLAPGQSSSFDQHVTLPQTAIPGVGLSQTMYVTLLVDPTNVVSESNRQNNQGVGPGYDTSLVTIVPQQPSDLIGTSLAASPGQLQWGGTLSVTAQIRNNAAGDAPATRARLVLTPAGQTPGGTSDVTIGEIAVPAISAYQTVNMVQSITLPPQAPLALAGTTHYTLTMMQDADFLTNPLYPSAAPQGSGLDQVGVEIDPGPGANAPIGALPQLAAGTVLAPTTPLAWGQSFQVATSVENIGQGDAGAFRVAFLLIGANGSINHALFLGDTIVPGLRAGFNQDVIETLHLPNRLPAGANLSSAGAGKIAVMVDPEGVVNEPYENNRTSESAPFVLRVLGTDGTSIVPTLPKAGAAVITGVTPPRANPRLTPAAQPRKLRRTLHPTRQTTLSRVEHTLSVFPAQAVDWIGGLIKKKKK